MRKNNVFSLILYPIDRPSHQYVERRVAELQNKVQELRNEVQELENQVKELENQNEDPYGPSYVGWWGNELSAQYQLTRETNSQQTWESSHLLWVPGTLKGQESY